MILTEPLMLLNPLYRVLFAYSLVVLFIGCTPNKEDVIDLNDIIPTSENNYESSDSLEDNTSTKVDLAFFNQGAFDFDNVTVTQERLFPDRFGPDSSVTYVLTQNNDTTKYHKWLFSDSTKVINAFYNWIDCFGKNCKSRYLGEEANFQTDASLILVTDTTLIFVESKSISFKDWFEFHNLIGYEKNWNYLVEQPYRGKAKWFVLKEDEKTKYIKK